MSAQNRSDALGVDEDPFKGGRPVRTTILEDNPGDLPKIKCPRCGWTIIYGSVVDGTIQPRCNQCHAIVRMEFGMDVVK